MSDSNKDSLIVSLDKGDVWDAKRMSRAIGHRVRLLEALGCGPGSDVIIFHGGSPEFFADLFAVWHLGASAACLNPKLTDSELVNMVDFISPTLILVDYEYNRSIELPVPVISSDREVADEFSVSKIGFGADIDNRALMLFTSGTTGLPKGVVHSYRSLLSRISLNRLYIGDDALSKTLCVLPTHFGHGLIGNALTPIFAQKSLVLSPVDSLRSASSLGDVIESHGITFMSSVPTVWKLALKVSKGPAVNTLKQVSVGSAPLSAHLWKNIMGWTGTDNVVNMYGITETANWLAGASALTYDPSDGLVGNMWGGTAAVLGTDGEVNAKGEGQLLVQTPSIMDCYYKRPDLTGSVIQDGWFNTGDVGRIDDDGSIWLTGRSKDEINRAGIKIHPAEIDSLLEGHPDVQEACAFGIPDEISGEIVGVAVSLSEGSNTKPELLRAWCLEHIRRESAPERWFVVEDIPKTDRGKINRQTVRESCIEQETLK